MNLPMGHVGELLIVLIVSTLALVGVWWMLHPGPPIRWLPRAPSYTLVALFGAGYNAVVERSWRATVFCLALAAAFRLGRWVLTNEEAHEWWARHKDVLVVGGAFAVMIGNVVWFLAGHPGVP